MMMVMMMMMMMGTPAMPDEKGRVQPPAARSLQVQPDVALKFSPQLADKTQHERRTAWIS
jgi:hypothetical protein